LREISRSVCQALFLAAQNGGFRIAQSCENGEQDREGQNGDQRAK